MVKKRGIKVLTDLLDLKGVKVISQRIYEGIGILLQTESTKSYSICPHYGTKSEKLHQNHRHIIKDLPFSEKPVFLEINRRQFKCSKCKKPFSEELDYATKKRTYTKRLAQKIIQEVLESDLHSVASKGIVTTEEIERMLKDAGEKLCDSKPSNLKRLGIDEIALVKGKGHYCAVLIDLDTSQLLAILNGRTQEIIKETLIGWGDEVLEHIEEVSIDLWQGYKNLVTELIPNAQVIEVKEVSPILKEMHELKEKIIKIFNQTKHWYTGGFKLGMWLSKAQKHFPRSHNTILRWFDEIIAYFENRTTSGTVEGINNKLKLIKRSGYGFRNFDNFRIRCLLTWTSFISLA